MSKENSFFVFWDANKHGKKAFYDAFKGLSNNEIHLSDAVYLICEYIYENENLKDESGLNAKERSEDLRKYFDGSSVKFQPLIIPSNVMKEGEADDISAIEKAIKDFVFPKLIKLNPSELHITLTSGTQSIKFAWISLFTKSLFTRSFGENVHIWQKASDRGNLGTETKSHELYEIKIDKNPFIDAIENKTHESKELPPVDLDFDGNIKRNAAVDVPMLILGERGIGKSTLIETTIVPEKLSKGFISKAEVQTIVCGQLDSQLAADELFGHEKGAFTGADFQKDGKIKLADKGILFLDEIQDLPRNIQRQLLRALQNKKFNRIGQKGSEETSDFRLVCASNNSLAKLQKKLDPDFFDRIATFKSYIKPLREQGESVLEDLWKNRWETSYSKGFVIPENPDSFSLVKQTLISSKMRGNIRDIEQLIAYIARDVYQGTTKITENIKSERYEKVLKDWLNDYEERYRTLKSVETDISEKSSDESNKEKAEETEKEKNDFNSAAKTFLQENSWKDINSLFKKWLADTTIEYFGSRKEAAKKLNCEEKTLYNAKENT